MSVLRCGCVAWLSLVTIVIAQSQPSGVDRVKEVGLSFAQKLSGGHYDEAATLVDDSVKKQMGPDVLKAAWEGIGKDKGAFQKLGAPTVTNMGLFSWVLVPCEWTQGRLRLKVVVNKGQKIIGIFTMPAASKYAGVKPAYLKTAVTTRDVTVGSKPWELPGILTLPQSGKPKAAVVLVQGSGPSDKDETIGPNKPFRDLALGLAQQGIASLRYDKRTYAYKLRMAATVSKITVDQEVVEDALLALKVLRAQPEIGGVPTYVLGHSLGAILAPEIASKDGQVAGAILLAGPAREMEDVIVDQFTYGVSLSPGPEGEAKLKEMTRDMERVRKHEARPEESIMSAPVSYWYDLGARDGQAAVKTATGLKCRLLVVQGGRDYQSTTEDFKLWQAALGKRPNATLKLFPDLNHLFAAGEGKARPDEYMDETHVDPRAITLIGGWCAKANGTAAGSASAAVKP